MEVGREFDGLEGGWMLHSKLDGCWMDGGGIPSDPEESQR
jgi:hypothetical protein